MCADVSPIEKMRVLPSILSNKLTRNPWQERMEQVLEKVILAAGADLQPSGSGQPALSQAAKLMADRARAEGAVLLPGALSGEVLAQLRSEFDHIIGTSDQSQYPVERQEGAICVRIAPRPSLNKQLYPAINAFYDSQVLFEVAKEFYSEDEKAFNFNSSIFVHETPETKTPLSGKMHWDRTQALKFWIYVDDIPVEAGPMRIQPGTTEANKIERIEKRRNPESLIGGKDNVISEDPEEVRMLAGPAGTILIHDSDCSHGASPVAPGYVRRIIRGHCRAAAASKSNNLESLLLNPKCFHNC